MSSCKHLHVTDGMLTKCSWQKSAFSLQFCTDIFYSDALCDIHNMLPLCLHVLDEYEFVIFALHFIII